MTIAKTPQPWIKQILFFGVVAVLTACGGSGGSDEPPDTTPNTFTIAAVNNVEPSAQISSAPIAISGINTATPVSISGGQYAINNGAFTAANGTVSNGQTIVVRVTAAATTDTDVSATLTVGGVSAVFTVVTLVDTTPPTAQITFPPPASMKEGDSILVRGTASDDYSTITSVTVAGVAAESDDGFANWTALVPLNNGDNSISVVVVDEQNNTNDAAASVAVRRAPATSAFPDNEVPINRPTGIAVDIANNRALVANFVSGDGDSVIAVDLATGTRTVLSGLGVPDDINPFFRPATIVIDPVTSRNRAIMADESGSIFQIDLSDGTRSIFSSSIVPNDQQPAFESPLGVALDLNNENVAYIIDSNLNNLQRIDLITGERNLVSDNSMPDSGPDLVMPEQLLIDSANNRAIVMDIFQPQLFSVDLISGERSVLFGNGVPEPESDVNCPIGLATDDIQSRIFITDCEVGINMLDLSTNTLSNVFGPVTTVGFNNGFLTFPVDAAFALYVERDTQALYAIDLENWDFVIMSKSVAD